MLQIQVTNSVIKHPPPKKKKNSKPAHNEPLVSYESLAVKCDLIKQSHPVFNTFPPTTN
jgi:hypothetical protein